MGKYEIHKASNGQYYFNLKAGNQQTILTSEMYVKKRERPKRHSVGNEKTARKTAAMRAKSQPTACFILSSRPAIMNRSARVKCIPLNKREKTASTR